VAQGHRTGNVAVPCSLALTGEKDVPAHCGRGRAGTAPGLLLGGLYALTALGLSLVLGVLRIINLAHGEFLILGVFLGY
jgi:hypothetical protein